MCYFTWKLDLVSNILWVIVEPYLFFSWYSHFTRPRASKAKITGDSFSNCENDPIKDVEDEEDNRERILQGDFIEDIKTTKSEHAVPKTITSVIKTSKKELQGTPTF